MKNLIELAERTIPRPIRCSCGEGKYLARVEITVDGSNLPRNEALSVLATLQTDGWVLERVMWQLFGGDLAMRSCTLVRRTPECA